MGSNSKVERLTSSAIPGKPGCDLKDVLNKVQIKEYLETVHPTNVSSNLGNIFV